MIGMCIGPQLQKAFSQLLHETMAILVECQCLADEDIDKQR